METGDNKLVLLKAAKKMNMTKKELFCFAGGLAGGDGSRSGGQVHDSIRAQASTPAAISPPHPPLCYRNSWEA